MGTPGGRIFNTAWSGGECSLLEEHFSLAGAALEGGALMEGVAVEATRYFWPASRQSHVEKRHKRQVKVYL